MIHAQTKSKLPLQWSLTSTAARHYLTLGYHREAGLSQLSTSEAGSIRRFFWLVYEMLEIGACLISTISFSMGDQT